MRGGDVARQKGLFQRGQHEPEILGVGSPPERVLATWFDCLAQIAFSSSMHHENIVRLLDVFAEKQQLVIVVRMLEFSVRQMSLMHSMASGDAERQILRTLRTGGRSRPPPEPFSSPGSGLGYNSGTTPAWQPMR